MPEQMICEVAELSRLNAYAYSMTLAAPAPLQGVLCGQFAHVKCGEARLLRRPISICDWQENTLRLVFEVRGAGTAWLSQRRVGDQIDLLAPLGRGFDLTGTRLLLVGGGIGVPPLLGCAKYQRHRGGAVHAVLGFRSADRAILLEDFQACGAEVSLCSDDGSLGTRGFADRVVRDLFSREISFHGVLACGPKPMLRAVAQAAAVAGVPCQVSLEERMGCGVGACLVCACKTADGAYKHVCKDGPVFPAQEVDWDA